MNSPQENVCAPTDKEINDRMNLIETKDINLEKIFPNIVKMKIEEVLKIKY